MFYWVALHVLRQILTQVLHYSHIPWVRKQLKLAFCVQNLLRNFAFKLKTRNSKEKKNCLPNFNCSSDTKNTNKSKQRTSSFSIAFWVTGRISSPRIFSIIAISCCPPVNSIGPVVPIGIAANGRITDRKTFQKKSYKTEIKWHLLSLFK